MRKVALIALIVSLFTIGFGQGIMSEDINTDLPPGVTLTMLNVAPSQEYGMAHELYVDPGFATAVISHGNSTTSFSLSVVSRDNVEIHVVSSHPDLIIVGEPVMRIRAGARMTVPLTAFSAHSGEILFYNLIGEEIARVPYEVTKDNGVRQSINTNVSTSGSIGAGYNIRLPNGLSFGTSIDYDTDDGSFGGRVSGSYSW